MSFTPIRPRRAETIQRLHCLQREPDAHLSGNAAARLAVRDYNDINRTDVSGIFSLGLTYRFNRWFAVSAVSSFATNDSNIDVFDYNVFNIGGALSGTFRF